jgi:hypothetical protein
MVRLLVIRLPTQKKGWMANVFRFARHSAG